jgi:hypothetical protein
MIVLDLSILNQKGTPMFNSDLTANRPAAGIVGRIFIAIDSPYGIFRDTGTAWDQVSAAGGTFSGSLATGQVAFGSATNTISGTNNLFWDNANTRLGIGTNSPGGIVEISSNGGRLRIRQNIASATFNGIDFVRADNLVYSSFIGNEQSGEIRWNAGNGYFHTFTNINVQALQISPNRNVLIGSSNIDNGQRLQVQGTSLFTGLATFNGSIFLSNFSTISSGSNNQISFETFRIQFNTSGNTLNAQYGYQFGGGNTTITSGYTGRMLIDAGFTPTSGNATYSNLALTTNINHGYSLPHLLRSLQ